MKFLSLVCIPVFCSQLGYQESKDDEVHTKDILIYVLIAIFVIVNVYSFCNIVKLLCFGVKQSVEDLNHSENQIESNDIINLKHNKKVIQHKAQYLRKFISANRTKSRKNEMKVKRMSEIAFITYNFIRDAIEHVFKSLPNHQENREFRNMCLTLIDISQILLEYEKIYLTRKY